MLKLLFRLSLVVILTVRGANEEPKTKQAAKRRAALTCEETIPRKPLEDIIYEKMETSTVEGDDWGRGVSNPDHRARRPLLNRSLSGKRKRPTEKNYVPGYSSTTTEEERETGVQKVMRGEESDYPAQEPSSSSQLVAESGGAMFCELIRQAFQIDAADIDSDCGADSERSVIPEGQQKGCFFIKGALYRIYDPFTSSII